MIECQIQPRATDNGFAGIINNRLKIRLRAPPIDGAANHTLIQYLAREFGVASGKVHLLKGDKHRLKTLSIEAPRRFPPRSGIQPPRSSSSSPCDLAKRDPAH